MHVCYHGAVRNPSKRRQGSRRDGKGRQVNGKQGQHEFAIVCRNRKQAEEIAAKLNGKDRPKQIEVD